MLKRTAIAATLLLAACSNATTRTVYDLGGHKAYQADDGYWYYLLFINGQQRWTMGTAPTPNQLRDAPRDEEEVAPSEEEPEATASEAVEKSTTAADEEEAAQSSEESSEAADTAAESAADDD